MAYPTDVLAALAAGDHYWRMGAASGAETDQKSSASLTVSGATRDVTGPAALAADDDGACSFDGGSSFASAALNLSAAAVITVAAWVKIDAYDTSNGLLYEHTANWNSNDGAVNVNPNNSTGGAEANTWSIGCGGPSGKVRVTIPQTAIPAGEWHHLAIVFNLTGSIKVYIDGAQIATTVRDGGTPSGTFANSTFYAASRGGSAQFWAGDIDELVVALSELSGDAIATLAGVVAPEAGTLYLNADHEDASDTLVAPFASLRAQASDPAHPLRAFAAAVPLLVDDDTLLITKASGNYGEMVLEGLAAQRVTIRGASGDTNRPLFTRRTVGDTTDWVFEDLIFDGIPGGSDFLYRNHALTDRRLTNRQGGGQIRNSTGQHTRYDCETSAPWSPSHKGNFMTGVGWRLDSSYQDDVAFEDLIFFRERFTHIGGEDAVQLAGLGNDSHTGKIRLEDCYWENIRQGAQADGSFVTGSTVHADCIQVSGGCNRLELSGGEFGPNCESFLICSDGQTKELLVENSLAIGNSISGFTIQLSGVVQMRIINNTITNSRFAGLRLYENNNSVPADERDWIIANNIVDKYEVDVDDALTDAEQHHNAILIGPATTADLHGFPEFGASEDTAYELANTPIVSAGINAADPALAPTVDRLARARIGAPDIGCHESNPVVTVTAQARTPFLVSVSPADRAINVNALSMLVATIKPKPGEEIDPATVDETTFYVAAPGGQHLPVEAITVSDVDENGDQQLILDIDGPLRALVNYTATLTTGIADTEGSTLAAPFTWTFRGPNASGIDDANAGAAGWVVGALL